MTLGTELLWIVPVAILVAIGFALFLIRDVLRRDTGTDKMMAKSELIYEGALHS